VRRLTASLLAGLGSMLFEIVLVLLTVSFILLEASSFPAKLRAILGEPKKDFHVFMRFVYDINRYMAMKTVISMTAGVLIGIWLSVLGVDFPILWGFLAFLLHYVPNIGALIATAVKHPEDQRRALGRLVALRVYVADEGTARFVRRELPARCPNARPIEFVRARVCRPELALEIEGVAEMGATPPIPNS
jgi:hypothetical protein